MKITPKLTLLRGIWDALDLADNLCGRCTPEVCDDNTAHSINRALSSIQELVRMASVVGGSVELTKYDTLHNAWQCLKRCEGDSMEEDKPYVDRAFEILDKLVRLPEQESSEAIRPHLAPAASGWQTIESAPKNGIRYLGMIVGDRFYGEPFVCYYDEDEGHICLHQTEARLHRPTHWQHFPAPTIPQLFKKD